MRRPRSAILLTACIARGYGWFPSCRQPARKVEHDVITGSWHCDAETGRTAAWGPRTQAAASPYWSSSTPLQCEGMSSTDVMSCDPACQGATAAGGGPMRCKHACRNGIGRTATTFRAGFRARHGHACISCIALHLSTVEIERMSRDLCRPCEVLRSGRSDRGSSDCR